MYSSDKKPLNLCDVLSTISDSGYNWSMTLTIVTTMMLRLTSINMKEMSKKMNLPIYLFFSNKLDISKSIYDFRNYNIIKIEIIKIKVTNEMLKIVKYLILNNMVKELIINFNNIGPNIKEILSNLLLKNEKNLLNSLDLSHNNIRNNGVEELAQLTCLTELTSLKLRHNNIFNYGATIIANTLLKFLTSIDLSHNMIGSEGVTSLAAVMSELKELNIANNRIGSEGATSLAKALINNINLTNLNIASNRIPPKGAKSLAEALKSARLVSLDLSKNYIGDNGASYFAHAFFKGLHMTDNHILQFKGLFITDLNLSSNNIGDIGVITLARGLENGNLLVHLNLANNKIGDIGAARLAKTLSCQCATLSSLCIYNNNISDNIASLYS
jgi:Ran GTPase-activating protein (RanGAP) involved in mRNA processing and transport